mgnify:CR=1 FL=1
MEKELWDRKVIENGGEFLQSWDWGAFQGVLGRKIIRFSDEIGMAQIIITPLPLNLSWAYIPRGPIFFDKEKSKDFIAKIIKIIPKNVVFVDFEPSQNVNLELPKFNSRQPERTLILDLTKNEDELLDKMHPKTRYGIRLAEKRELEFKELDSEMEFYKVLKLTSGRQKFRTYNELYFNLMKKNLDPAQLKFFGVLNSGEVIASGLFYCFGETAIYLHGGSNYNHRALMAPYLLHWEAMKFFKKIGIKYYDFWGVDENRWPGVTRFKTRFGGEIKEYPGARVKILKPFWFKIYQVAKR